MPWKKKSVTHYTIRTLLLVAHSTPIRGFFIGIIKEYIKNQFFMKDAFLTINGKEYSHRDINLVRDFFTDDQWSLIDGALSEFKDHDPEFLNDVYGSEDILTKTEDIIYQIFRSAY